MPWPKADLLERLRETIATCEGSHRVQDRPLLSTGIRPLDRLLPRHGIQPGSLVEWLDDQMGDGSETLAARLTQAAATDGDIVVIDRERQFYPPALAAWGIPFDRLVIVQPATERDELWAAHQALRCPAASIVWLRRSRLLPHDFRRLSLAAEQGGTIGMVFRPLKVRGQPTWADLQLCVLPQPSLQGKRLRIEVTRCRGHLSNSVVEVDVDDVTGLVREVNHYETLRMRAPAALAYSAAHRRAPRMARASHPRAPT